MSELEDLQPGVRLGGVIPGQNVAVIAVQPRGPDAVELTYKTAEGLLGQRVLGRDAESKLAIATAEARPLDAVAADIRLVAECRRSKLAGLSDPMPASDIQANQLRAVLVSHPTVSERAGIPDGMPGRELVIAGLDDLRAGRDTVEAMLVATGAPRLRACGIDVPGGDRLDSGLRMFRLLGDRDAASAYSTYNALRRRLSSFLVSLEQHARRSHR